MVGGKQTGLPIDLPTEAQWEYAARNRGQNVVFATDTGLLEPGRNFTREEEFRFLIDFRKMSASMPQVPWDSIT